MALTSFLCWFPGPFAFFFFIASRSLPLLAMSYFYLSFCVFFALFQIAFLTWKFHKFPASKSQVLPPFWMSRWACYVPGKQEPNRTSRDTEFDTSQATPFNVESLQAESRRAVFWNQHLYCTYTVLHLWVYPYIYIYIYLNTFTIYIYKYIYIPIHMYIFFF